jgi:pseudaminic acid cytidylyltransferase
VRLAVIPARGGSKRIPQKNIRDFCGKPIISYTIATAKTCGLFDHVIVSTDDAEIAEVARRFGAEAPFVRPRELSDDFTGTNAVVKHAVLWFRDRGTPVTEACCMYATAPLLDASFVRWGHELLVKSGKLYAFSVTSFPYPIQRALRLLPDGSVEALHPEHAMTRSQDLEPAYHDAGQFYWGAATAFIEDLPMFARHSIGVALPPHLVQDIDTLEDWERAELMYQAHQARRARNSVDPEP